MDVFWFNIFAPQNQVICNSSVKNWHIFKMVVSAAEMRLILISITKEMQNKSYLKREQHRWLKFQNWILFFKESIKPLNCLKFVSHLEMNFWKINHFHFFFSGWKLRGLHCYQFFNIRHSWLKASELCKR